MFLRCRTTVDALISDKVNIFFNIIFKAILIINNVNQYLKYGEGDNFFVVYHSSKFKLEDIKIRKHTVLHLGIKKNQKVGLKIPQIG